MDAYELGWRLRPNKDLLFELSVYQYDTQNAVRTADSMIRSLPIGPRNAQAYGGELSVDWRFQVMASSGRIFSGEREPKGVRVYDFPKRRQPVVCFRYSDQTNPCSKPLLRWKDGNSFRLQPDHHPRSSMARFGGCLGAKEGWKSDFSVAIFLSLIISRPCIPG